MPDGDRLVRGEVDTALSCEEPIDLALGCKLGVEKIDINLNLLITLIWFGVHLK